MNLYQPNETNILYHGDCIEVMKGLEDNSIDMIFADPPYNLSNGTFTCASGKRASVVKGVWDIMDDDTFFKFNDSWITETKRILKPSGTMWVMGTYHSIYTCGYLLQRHNYKVLNDIIWFKPNASPNLSCTRFTASHEHLIWVAKFNSRHTFNYKEMKQANNNKQMRSVWNIPTTPKKEKSEGKYPTQKPIKLLDRLIKSSTKQDDLILDIFMGSGTTAVVAKHNQRRYVGIDSNIESINLTLRRLKNETNSCSN